MFSNGRTHNLSGGRGMRRTLTALLPLILMACGICGCGADASGAQDHASTSGSASRGTAAGAQVQSVNIQVGNLTRNYLLYVPSSESATHRLPLVLVYPGATSTALDAESQTGLLTLAQQRQNMIVAFLQGVQSTWNDDAGNPPAEAEHVDDIGFSKAVLNQVESRYPVDMKRVVLTGISNGAIMVELLGCRIGGLVTLVVPVEGQMGNKFAGNCRPAKPVSVYEIHQTADPAIPYSGGTFGGIGGPVTVLSAPASAARWATVDHCAKRASTSKSSGSIFTKYGGCGDGVGVTLDTVIGGAHVFPPGFAQSLAKTISSLGGRRIAKKPAAQG